MLILILRHQLRHREQRGQTLLIFALAFIVLVGIVGLATDSAYGYYESVQIERAAAAAALAGVPYMPASFTTPVAGPNGTTRAVAEATANGFTNGGNVSVVVSRTGSPQELQVQITQQIPTFFLRGLGIQNYTVARTAVARYRQPIALGQPGDTLGATVSQLATGGNFYFLREKGWTTQRGEGDAFTPHPTDGDCTFHYSFPGSCGVTPQAVSDVHRISGQLGTESNDALTGGAQPLPARGGYNYLVTIPTGQTGTVQVYNAVYGPDFAGTHNNCENVRVRSGGNCSATGAYYHEDDVGGSAQCTAGSPPVCSTTNQRQYNASEFTLFQVKDIFLRRTDKVLTRTTVFPIDATNWNGATPSYIDVRSQQNITQTYDLAGNPTNMNVYHSWADIANLQNARNAPASLIRRQTGGGYVDDAVLPPGTYRLRVDSVNFDGVTPTTAGCPNLPTTAATVVCGIGSKGYAVRVNGCAVGKCTISALEDMCVNAPVTGGGGSIPIFNLSSDYAGATVNTDFYDVGDTSDTNELSVLDPGTGTTFDTGGSTLHLIIDGVNQPPAPQIRHFKPQPPDGPNVGEILPHTGGFADSQAGFEADTSGTSNSNGSWVEFQIPIPSSYAGSANYFKLNYDIKNNGTGNDTFTLAVNATGGPIRLFRS